MDEFDVRGHACLIGNVLIVLGFLAFGLVLADFVPDEIFALPPHFFGNDGAVVVGLMMLVAGFYLRRSGA
jgi:hypothetical protein